MNTIRHIKGWTHNIHMPQWVMWLEHMLANKYFWVAVAVTLFIALLVILAILAPQGSQQPFRPFPYGPFPYGQ